MKKKNVKINTPKKDLARANSNDLNNSRARTF